MIYYFHSDLMPFYLITVFGKNDKSNLTAEECNQLAAIGERLSSSCSQICCIYGYVAALGGGSIAPPSRLGLAQRDQAQPQGRDQSARRLGQVPHW